jgi:V8-like Glu-specific endopeptidase
MRIKTTIYYLTMLFVFIYLPLNAQKGFNPDTVKAQKFDTGKMWAFEYPPFEYLKQVYNFTPTQEWFDDVRLSALSLGGCTASFVSNDGLLMTNNHCARGHRRNVQKPGEDLEKTGFIALTLEEERKVPNMQARQLRFLKDVTKEVLAAMKAGKNEKEKIALRDTCTRQLARKYNSEQGLECRVISYYNGGVYYVQGYKVFTDIRYVFQAEEQTASFGRDPDNFTYPRYALDIALFRVYENGKPIKTDHYFHWSANGAAPGEFVFTVGTPGTTNRLRTVAQLEYMRDVQFRNSVFQSDNLYKRLDQLKVINPANAADYEREKLVFSNGWKSATYTLKALNDPYLMARKKAFEKKIQDVVMKDPVLKKEFGHVWKTIEGTRKELTGIDTKLAAYSAQGQAVSRYQTIANTLVNQARLAKMTQAERDALATQQRGGRQGGGRPGGPGGQQALYPDNFDPLVEKAKLEISIDYIIMNLGKNDPMVKKMFQGKSGKEVADELIKKSLFKSKEIVEEFQKKTPDEILKLNDPFIQYYAQVYDKVLDLRKKQTEVTNTENVAFSLLGQIMFKIYGTTIPPDANGTLRLSDGVLKSYNYNGTTAPIKTTFYGLYDRYFGNEGKYPFNLAERWQNIPMNFDLSTPFDFISTNDIIGGSSGSAVINKNAEVIGLAFDGNVESMEGNFIYRDESNRCVSVDSKGIYEAIKKVYKADRIADELKSGKMVIK